MKYVLGVDFGGGACKATLLAACGTVIATATAEYPSHTPRSGYVEQDPRDWLNAAVKNIREVTSRIDVRDIACLAFDAATHTAVLLDKDGEPLMPSIYWTDTRSTAEKAKLEARYGEIIRAETLHSVDTVWTLPQLEWVRKNRPEVWEKASLIVFAKDYVRRFFTGDLVTDTIEAAGSMFFDVARRAWSKTLCGAIGLDESRLPAVVEPTSVVGAVSEKAAAVSGLAAGTPVICGTTDTAMEVFAAGAVEPGCMTVKLATAGRICVITEKPVPHRHLINYEHIVPGLWYPGTGTKSCAASYRWFRDTFGGDYAALDEEAARLAAGSDGLMFHPYLNGELTPYADPALCADFTGIRAHHTKAHFARAVMEGAAFSLLDCLKTLDTLIPSRANSAFILGGGGKSPLWRQITADVLGVELVKRRYTDSSFGSAMLAGIAAGFWDSPSAALDACNGTEGVTKVDEETHARYGALFERYKAVHDALAPIYHGESAK